jgi:RimJ/RimL family protein N-acetyltransferase
MKMQERSLPLKDGRTCLLRSPEPGDAEKILAYLKKTAAETHFLLRGPDEVLLTEEEERAFLRSQLDDEKQGMLAAFLNGEVIATLHVGQVGPRKKVCHRAQFGMAVVQEYWGLGLGRVLIEIALSQAKAMGFEQLELGVFMDNHRARRMYEAFGFEQWGRMRRAFKLADGSYRDELLMGIYLIDSENEQNR